MAKDLPTATVITRHGFKEFLVVNIFASNGRPFRAPVVKTPNARTLNTPVFDLDILADLKTIDALILWKYAGDAYKFISPGRPAPSLIEGLKFYRDREDSLAVLNVYTPVFPPGYSFDWKLAALRKADRHSLVRISNGKQQIVPLGRMDTYAPVYVSEMELQFGHMIFAVDIGAVPMWVGPDPAPDLKKSALKTVYYLFTDAIAYWVWQLEADIAAPLAGTGKPAIRIGFLFDNPTKFGTLNQHYVN